MRFIVGLLACAGLGLLSLARADSPNSSATQGVSAGTTPSAAAAATAHAATASSAAPATPAAPPALDFEEKHLLAEGYRVEIRHGQKMFCRREEVLGSRVEGQKFCGTAEQLKATESQAKEAVERTRHQQANPTQH
ncbi:MAG TPA: hypothetical protein VFK87_12735 [Steroidobacteraceae bacterium]|nr:hypothetical protein [Steroidobacteraceae bacterium]